MTSLWLSVVALLLVVFSVRVNVAGTPLTVTASTLKVLFASVLVVPWKSKEYDDRGAPVVFGLDRGVVDFPTASWSLPRCSSSRR